MRPPTICLLLLALAGVARAQYFDPGNGVAIEVSLENTSLPRLPIHRNAITSLTVAGDSIVGGTSADAGLTPYLFVASLSRKRTETVFPLDRAVPGQRALCSGFGRGPNGTLYVGTMPGSSTGSGHLLQLRLRETSIEVTDLGTPVPQDGILALTADANTDTIYGIASPSGRLFSFHVPDRRTTVYDETKPRPDVLRSLALYVLRPEDFLSRRLILDRAGRVYGSCPPGRLFRFDPVTSKVEILGELPSVGGRAAIGRVDAWALGPDGILYGGNAGDGQLFAIDPQSRTVVNLGKPAMMPRMQGIAFGRDGVLYGVTGAPPGYAHVFTWDSTRGFVDSGNPYGIMTAPGIEQGIPWRAFHIATIAASDDGRYIVMGEAEALSQLMIFEIADRNGTRVRAAR